MNPYDAWQQFIEGLEQYIAGIETAEGLLRLARNASGSHDRLPLEGLSSHESSIRKPELVFV